ncbi:MAG TPA: hypothetical protein PKA13_20535 [Geminicoccaceae bacterium]|nr:hypothetical protein [Geminicoccus sp.]HMU52177.1 hypothetical protein [Geminicoccaceae bacterium]
MRIVLPALAAALAAAPVHAGILLEGRLEGQEVRVELGAIVTDKAVVTVGGDRRVVRLDRPAPAAADPYRLRRWSGGPQVAGYGSNYNVLTLDQTICGEVLASPWMAEFLAPAVQALALVQQGDPRLAPKEREGCGVIPFGVFAYNGFPLMAGWRDEAVFVTERILFDHPTPAELRPPGSKP